MKILMKTGLFERNKRNRFIFPAVYFTLKAVAMHLFNMCWLGGHES